MPHRAAAATATNHNSELRRNRSRFMVNTSVFAFGAYIGLTVKGQLSNETRANSGGTKSMPSECRKTKGSWCLTQYQFGLTPSVTRAFLGLTPAFRSKATHGLSSPSGNDSQPHWLN